MECAPRPGVGPLGWALDRPGAGPGVGPLGGAGAGAGAGAGPLGGAGAGLLGGVGACSCREGFRGGGVNLGVLPVLPFPRWLDDPAAARGRRAG